MAIPDWLIFSLHGPEAGRRYNLKLFRESGWKEILQEDLCTGGEYFYIFGASAHLLRPWMQGPYYRNLATFTQLMLKAKMSDVGTAVEHNYKKVKQDRTSQNFARNIKVSKPSVTLLKLNKSLTLLLNMHGCLYKRGQGFKMFGPDPFSLDAYLNSL